jgi:hypothetical protein
MKHYHEEQAKEMKRLLEQEILHWPQVSSKKMFGCPGYQAGDKLFAFLVTDGVVLTQLDEAERESLFRQYPSTFFQAGEKIIRSWARVFIDEERELKQLLPYLRRSYETALRQN